MAEDIKTSTRSYSTKMPWFVKIVIVVLIAAFAFCVAMAFKAAGDLHADDTQTPSEYNKDTPKQTDWFEITDSEYGVVLRCIDGPVNGDRICYVKTDK